VKAHFGIDYERFGYQHQPHLGGAKKVAGGRGAGPQGQGSGKGIAAVVGVILLLGYFAGRERTSSSSEYQSPARPMSPMTTSNNSAPVEMQYQELQPGSAQRGHAHFRLVTQIEGLTGARIYSENCYAALARNFSWNKLDQCGAADLAASRLAASAFSDASAPDLSHFEPETAAARYLSAATGAGASAEVADQRLSALQRLVERRQVERSTKAAPANEEIASEEEPPIEEPPQIAPVHPGQRLTPVEPTAPSNDADPKLGNTLSPATARSRL
jgi:hypothetical protein